MLIESRTEFQKRLLECKSTRELIRYSEYRFIGTKLFYKDDLIAELSRERDWIINSQINKGFVKTFQKEMVGLIREAGRKYHKAGFTNKIPATATSLLEHIDITVE